MASNNEAGSRTRSSPRMSPRSPRVKTCSSLGGMFEKQEQHPLESPPSPPLFSARSATKQAEDKKSFPWLQPKDKRKEKQEVTPSRLQNAGAGSSSTTSSYGRMVSTSSKIEAAGSAENDESNNCGGTSSDHDDMTLRDLVRTKRIQKRQVLLHHHSSSSSSSSLGVVESPPRSGHSSASLGEIFHQATGFDSTNDDNTNDTAQPEQDHQGSPI